MTNEDSLRERALKIIAEEEAFAAKDEPGNIQLHALRVARVGTAKQILGLIRMSDSVAPPQPVAESGWQPVLKFARRAAFLGAHINDREDGADILARELHRLYDAVTDLDGGEEPDLTFCCGCREEIEIADGQEQWVLDGAKYHKRCYEAIVAEKRPEVK